MRGLRLSLARPELLVTQLRAVLRAAAVAPLSVMFPMVSEVGELRAAMACWSRRRASLADDGLPAGPVELGVMIEVPAAALRAGTLAAEVDFLSIGTNDLVQYTMAAERGNGGVARLSDPLHPAVLQLIDGVVTAAAAARLPGRGLRRGGVRPSGRAPAGGPGSRRAERGAAPRAAGEGVGARRSTPRPRASSRGARWSWRTPPPSAPW